jgi:anthranilate phosphoribosyltransferase
MFAPNHHAAMKHAAPVRRELGVRTLFNLLGPLTNPAGAPNQVMGVYHPDLVDVQARVLHELGARHALVVHGMEGLDEISIAGETLVAELKEGAVSHYRISPEDFGLKPHALDEIKVADAAQSSEMVLAVLEGQHEAGMAIVALNAGASIYASGLAPTLMMGVMRAREVIASGAARATLQKLVDYTRSMAA